MRRAALALAGLILPLLAAGGTLANAAQTQPADPELQALRAEIAAERRQLDVQQEHLRQLDDRLLAKMRGTGIAEQIPPPPPLAGDVPNGSAPTNDLARSGAVQNGAAPVPAQVGTAVAPTERERTVELAVISDQGGIVTRRGQITIEPSFEYAHADRNRVIFRGIEVPPAVAIGVFDINENRQDILTAAIGLRYGVSSRIELNARVPFVYRNDVSILAPTQQNQSGRSDVPNFPAKGRSLGDVEFGARYQLTNGRSGFPYLIAGLQAVAPTGTNPFLVRRDSGTGVALEAATGAGFWGVTPTLTALLPSDPAVLFGTLGYTRNFGRRFDGVAINQNALIDNVKPGDALQGSGGIGISLNPRLALSLGYAHTWSFGTRTIGRSVSVNVTTGATTSTPFDTTLRDLQVGRFLFGVSYRTAPSTTINWNIEVGATRDAADVRTTLRIPISFGGDRVK
jgi:hypothetical protein